MKCVIFTGLLAVLSPAWIQPSTSNSRPAVQAALVSPEVGSDRRVTFRLRAPNASEVTITGDFWLQQNRVDKLLKDPDGIWSLTTDPLPAGYYSYVFSIDGVHLPDPLNGSIKPGVSETQSTFFVPGAEASVLQSGTVPHGEIRELFYASSIAGKLCRMHVYLPPGYDNSKSRLPTVYLLHGGGDDDGAWESVGRVNFILDNLIFSGKAKPMIVVMPSLWMSDPPLKADRRTQNLELFEKSLRNEIVPYVNAHFRTLPGSVNRAVGGLGDGRDFLPTLVWNSMDLFDSVLFVSGGADKDRFSALQQAYPGRIDKPSNVSRVKFFMGDGINDSSFSSAKNLSDELKKRGYTVRFVESERTHGWPEFRYNFIEFVQTAFR